MPIASGNFGAVLFLLEIGLQCHLFNRSIKRLELAADHWIKLDKGIDDGGSAPPLEIVADCTVCLSAMAAIRRILQPSDRSGERAKRRSEALMKLLNHPRFPNLTSMAVRNSWEHLDERMDEMLATRTTGPVSELYVSPKPPSDDAIVMRRFDPIGFTIYFAKDSISIKPCIAEIDELTKLVSQAYKRLHTEVVDV
jgi:hypothetical protein